MINVKNIVTAAHGLEISWKKVEWGGIILLFLRFLLLGGGRWRLSPSIGEGGEGIIRCGRVNVNIIAVILLIVGGFLLHLLTCFDLSHDTQALAWEGKG